MPPKLEAYEPAPTYGVCPECGVSLEGADLEKHSLGHWPSYLPDNAYSPLAKARKAQLLAGGVAADKYRADEPKEV